MYGVIVEFPRNQFFFPFSSVTYIVFLPNFTEYEIYQIGNSKNTRD